jgi:hypothetical protein
MTIRDVFDLTHADGAFTHHMSSFAQMFLQEPTLDRVSDEPCYFDSIEKKHYVYAGCFVHYWCDVFLIEPPSWVLKSLYVFDEPVYTFPELKNELEKITPHQCKQHNYFMRRTDVLYA